MLPCLNAGHIQDHQNPCSSCLKNNAVPFLFVNPQLPPHCIFPSPRLCWSCFCAGCRCVNQQQWGRSPLRSWGIIQVAAESGSCDSSVLEHWEQLVLTWRGTGAAAQLGTAGHKHKKTASCSALVLLHSLTQAMGCCRGLGFWTVHLPDTCPGLSWSNSELTFPTGVQDRRWPWLLSCHPGLPHSEQHRTQHSLWPWSGECKKRDFL